jgi:Fe2+ or Zn2+ uptake regulation protein
MEPEELNESDYKILEVLREGRATPAALKDWTGRSGQTVHNRLGRLVAAGHVEKVHESGLYELVDDPRQDEKMPICTNCNHRVVDTSDERGDYFCSNCNAVLREEDVKYD